MSDQWITAAAAEINTLFHQWLHDSGERNYADKIEEVIRTHVGEQAKDDDQWIEDAAKEAIRMMNFEADWGHRRIMEAIAKHHVCPAVTAEKLLAQVEAIAETIRGKIEPQKCKRCIESINSGLRVMEERDEARAECEAIRHECHLLRNEMQNMTVKARLDAAEKRLKENLRMHHPTEEIS